MGAAGQTLTALARALDGAGSVREAEAADAVDGVTPQAVVRPGNAAAVAAVMAEAARCGLTVVPRGAGTALDWGAPPKRVDVVLDTTGLARLLEHEAGDLVVVAEAGLALGRLAELLAPAGQELVADVARDRVESGATVGGALATGAGGPRRLVRGPLRDLVLGATVVRADGVLSASGGKVVKNVAGYDLARLMTGSFGTLAVIVAAAFRLHPLPAARAFVQASGAPREIADAARLVVGSQVAPAAVEIDRAPGSAHASVTVLLEGAAGAVAARAAAVAALVGGSVADEPAWWGRTPTPAGVLLKITATLPGVARVLDAARAAEQAHGVPISLRGSAAGVLHAGLPADADPGSVAAVVETLRQASPGPGDGTVTVLRAPRPIREGLDPWGEVRGLGLMRRVKDQFDPDRRLSPGRFVGGI